MKQLRAFIIKEFLHIFRDKRTMLILLGMPVILMSLFGFAISNEIKNIRVGILTPVINSQVRNLTHSFDNNEYFEVVTFFHSPEEIDASFRKDNIDLAIVFPDQFESNRSKKEMQIQLITDATDPNKSNLSIGYALRILEQQLQKEKIITNVDLKDTASLVRQQLLKEKMSQKGNTTIKLLYNPQMKSSYNFVPGVMGMLLMLLCAMMTSISIVREKEMGTMEVLLVSPMHPSYIIAAKMIPYLALSFINLLTILLLSNYVLQVPVGSHLFLLILSSILFAAVALSLGLLISTLANKQIEAMIGSVIVLLLPTILLSGMIFPVENMPWLLQIISNILPAYWFIDLIRKVMIEGLGVTFVWKNILVLIIMGLTLTTISFKLFKHRLA